MALRWLGTWWRRFWWSHIAESALGRALVQTGLLIIIGILNPFELSDAVDMKSRDVAFRVASTQYPATAQEQIVVVNITDRDLAGLQKEGERARHWPLPYGDIVTLLRLISRHQPAGIFMDLLFSHDHDEPGEIKKFASYLAALKKRTTVVLAGMPQSVAEPMSNRRDGVLADIHEAANYVAAAGWSGSKDAYPLRVVNGSGQEHATAMLTPAAALYDVHLGRLHNDQSGDVQRARDWIRKVNDPKSDPSDLPDMVVRWGGTVPKKADYVFDNSKCPNPRSWGSFGERLLHGLAAGISDPSRGKDASGHCHFHLTLSYEDVRHLSEDPERAKLVFANAFVIVGADIVGIKDYTRSPTHGMVSGAHLHAMALDNLITSGRDYLRNPQDIIGGIDGMDATVIIMLLALLLSTDLVHGILAEKGRKQNKAVQYAITAILLSFVGFVLAFSLAGAVIWASWDILRLAPLNWLALLSAALSVFGYLADNISTLLAAGPSALSRTFSSFFLAQWRRTTALTDEAWDKSDPSVPIGRSGTGTGPQCNPPTVRYPRS